MTSYSWYDNTAKQYQMTTHKVAALVKKHSIPKRRIYGNMAVDSDAWDKLMQDLDIPLAPGYTLIRKGE